MDLLPNSWQRSITCMLLLRCQDERFRDGSLLQAASHAAAVAAAEAWQLFEAHVPRCTIGLELVAIILQGMDFLCLGDIELRLYLECTVTAMLGWPGMSTHTKRLAQEALLDVACLVRFRMAN
jgi:hypothetical protein